MADPEQSHDCIECSLLDACQGPGPDFAGQQLRGLARRLGPFPPGTHLFRTGDPFHAISTVHSGTVKTFVIDAEGREQVLGFFLPGEVIGLGAIDSGHYPCNAVALDTVHLCSVAFPALAALATHARGVQQELFRLLSHGIRKASLMAGDASAEVRIAAFLVLLRRHHQASGGQASRLHLTMSRGDIANYLRLAPETVSRVMRRFQDEALLHVAGREVELIDPARIENLARAMLPDLDSTEQRQKETERVVCPRHTVDEDKDQQRAEPGHEPRCATAATPQRDHAEADVNAEQDQLGCEPGRGEWVEPQDREQQQGTEQQQGVEHDAGATDRWRQHPALTQLQQQATQREQRTARQHQPDVGQLDLQIERRHRQPGRPSARGRR